MPSLFYRVNSALIVGLLLFVNGLHAIPWNDLSPNLSGKTVEIRGFLYESEAGEWILDREPALKSCCRGSMERRGQQLYIEGWEGEKAPKRALTLEGEIEWCEGRYTLRLVRPS